MRAPDDPAGIKKPYILGFASFAHHLSLYDVASIYSTKKHQKCLSRDAALMSVVGAAQKVRCANNNSKVGLPDGQSQAESGGLPLL